MATALTRKLPWGLSAAMFTLLPVLAQERPHPPPDAKDKEAATFTISVAELPTVDPSKRYCTVSDSRFPKRGLMIFKGPDKPDLNCALPDQTQLLTAFTDIIAVRQVIVKDTWYIFQKGQQGLLAEDPHVVQVNSYARGGCNLFVEGKFRTHFDKRNSTDAACKADSGITSYFKSLQKEAAAK
jgi:hypothetical protein